MDQVEIDRLKSIAGDNTTSSQAAPAISPEEIARLKSLAGEPAASDNTQMPGYVKAPLKVLSAVAKPFQYVEGAGRNALAQGYDLKNKLMNELGLLPDDYTKLTREGDTAKAMLHNEAPTGADYLERVGVKKGGQLSDVIPGYAEPNGKNAWYTPEKGGALDPSARGAAGAAIDAVTSPFNLLLGGAPEIAERAGIAASNPVSAALKLSAEGAEKAGYGLYKSAPALERADLAAAKTGNNAVPSRVLYESGAPSGPAGSTMGMKGLNVHAQELADRLLEQRKKLVSDAAEMGARVDPNDVLKPIEELKTEWLSSKDPTKKAAMNNFLSKNEGLLQDFKDLKDVTPQQMLDMTTSRYKNMPKNAFGGYDGSDLELQLEKALAHGTASSAKNSIPSALGGPESLKSIQDQLGAMLAVDQTLNREAGKTISSKLVTPVDAITYGVTHSPGTIAAKKLADLYKSNIGRTSAGSAMKSAGSGLEKLGEATNSQSPWLNMLLSQPAAQAELMGLRQNAKETKR